MRDSVTLAFSRRGAYPKVLELAKMGLIFLVFLLLRFARLFWFRRGARNVFLARKRAEYNKYVAPALNIARPVQNGSSFSRA